MLERKRRGRSSRALRGAKQLVDLGNDFAARARHAGPTDRRGGSAPSLACNLVVKRPCKRREVRGDGNWVGILHHDRHLCCAAARPISSARRPRIRGRQGCGVQANDDAKCSRVPALADWYRPPSSVVVPSPKRSSRTWEPETITTAASGASKEQCDGAAELLGRNGGRGRGRERRPAAATYADQHGHLGDKAAEERNDTESFESPSWWSSWSLDPTSLSPPPLSSLSIHSS